MGMEKEMTETKVCKLLLLASADRAEIRTTGLDLTGVSNNNNNASNKSRVCRWTLVGL
jgi:hypothetical protein